MVPRTVIAGMLLMAVLAVICQETAALEAQDVLYFRAGPLTLRPQVGLSEVYNDNVFYLSTNPAADFITVISPGLKLQLGRPEEDYIALNYTLDQLFYADNPNLDAQQHSFEIRDQFHGQHISLVGSDRFQLLNSPLGGVVERVVGTNGVASIVERNVQRLLFDDIYTLSYALGEKTQVYLRGNHNSSDYEQGVQLYDIATLTGTAGFAYRAFAKTFFFGELYYGQTRTDPNAPGMPNNPRMSFFGGYVGARGNFTSKLSGTVKVGYEAREFSDGTSAPSDPVVDLSLTQRFSEKQALSLTYSRQNNVSIQYSRQTYAADTIGLQFSQVLGPSRKWQATVGGSYSMYAYETSANSSSNTDYTYLRGSFNLAYQIQLWLSANLGYDYERVRGDSSAVIDYDVNRVTLRFIIGY